MPESETKQTEKTPTPSYDLTEADLGLLDPIRAQVQSLEAEAKIILGAIMRREGLAGNWHMEDGKRLVRDPA